MAPCLQRSFSSLREGAVAATYTSIPEAMAGYIVRTRAGPLTILECRAVVENEVTFDQVAFVLPPSREKLRWLVGDDCFDFSAEISRTVIPVNDGQPSRAEGAGPCKPYSAILANTAYLSSLAEELYDIERLTFEPRMYTVEDTLLDDVARLTRAAGRKNAEGCHLAENLASLVAIGLLRSCIPEGRLDLQGRTRHAGIRRARSRMKQELAAGLSIKELAATASLSRSQFISVFKRETGRTPHEYLRCLRIEEAKRLFRAGRDVTSTCFAVGFCSLSGFEEAFADLVRMTPVGYRAQYL
jgi:AraC family transcriptional regulator